MKNKRIFWIIFGIVLFLILVAIFFILIRAFSGEDSWIQDSKGIWVKHGNPSETPNYVLEQQEAIYCANYLYDKEKSSGSTLNSQCLGLCGAYAVDLVNVPRTEADNLEENQCSSFVKGYVSHFIELDKDGNVVRIA